MEEKKELSIGREIAKEVTSDVCALGAGILVGGLALSVIENMIPGGKLIKTILRMGAYGLEIKTLFDVKKAVGEYTEAVFQTIDTVKEVFGGSNKKEGTERVQAEGAIE